MSKPIAEKFTRCKHCKHFIFKDDMVDFCVNCGYKVLPAFISTTEPDIDFEIVYMESGLSTWSGYINDCFNSIRNFLYFSK